MYIPAALQAAAAARQMAAQGAPFPQFQEPLTLFEVLFTFPSRCLSAIGLEPTFSFR